MMMPNVLDVQKALASWHFDPGPQDGILGSKTLGAIKAFQSANKFVVYRLVGPAALAALDLAVPKAPPKPGPVAPAGVVNLSSLIRMNAGKLASVKGVIVHHTGGRGDATGVASTLAQRRLGVQYVMDRAGHVYQLMPAQEWLPHPAERARRRPIQLQLPRCEVIAKDDTDVLPVQVKSFLQFAAGLAATYPNIVYFGHGEINPHHKLSSEGLTIAKAVRREAPFAALKTSHGPFVRAIGSGRATMIAGRHYRVSCWLPRSRLIAVVQIGPNAVRFAVSMRQSVVAPRVWRPHK